MLPRVALLQLLASLVLIAGCATQPAPAGEAAPSRTRAASPSAAAASPAASGAAATPTPRPDQVASNMQLVGALKLSPPNSNAYGDLAVNGNLAFVGRASWSCPAHGVDIIDISDPAQPALLSSTSPLPAVATEDLAAVRIAGRDVLVVGLQSCIRGVSQRAGTNGLDLWDISDPRQPQRIAQFKTQLGVHEFGLATLPDGRAAALLAVPELELSTETDDRRSTGDLLIVDISDPQHPRQIGEWGVLDEPNLGRDFAVTQQRGTYSHLFLHSVRASSDGRRAFLSYWDGGVIILDISDPSHPRYLGRTAFAPTDEGNAHSVAVSPDGRLLVQADEDVSPTNIVLRSSAFEGGHVIQPLSDLSGWALGKPVVGTIEAASTSCPAPSAAGGSASGTALAGKVAVVGVGDCGWQEAIAQAQQNGVAGLILYDSEAITLPRSIRRGSPLASPPAGARPLRTPTVYASAQTAKALLEATAPVTVESGSRFDGWGGVRLFDVADPAEPVLLSTYLSPAATDESLPSGETGPWWTAHDPFLDGSTLYVSWYSDGVRVLDVSDPRSPREIGHWAGLGAPADAPPVFIWGVVAHNGYVFAGDMNYGLYVLRLER